MRPTPTSPVAAPNVTPGGSSHGKGRFRADIEGLRALAVVPIVLNHAQVRGFPGGFVGVDIFFVISGYLITGILTRDIESGRYSIGEFYRRRVLRIFPAMVATLLATTIIALFVTAPSELVNIAKSALATMLFASNVHFYGDTGYFASEAASRPLLHTWSLAVEEQFYIFWPFLLAFLVPKGKMATWLGLAGLTLISLALAIWMVGVDMSAAFYLIPFRTWELAAGGLLAFWKPGRPMPRWAGEGLSLAGLCAILYCIRAYHEPLVFPGLTAIPPVLGTVAIIAAGPGNLVNRALSISVPRFFGRISYSLYLWHWPVIVFTGLWLFLPQSPWVIAGQLVLSTLMAWASYRLIEAGGRDFLDRIATPKLLRFVVATIGAAVALYGAIIALQGFPGRFDPRQRALSAVLARDEQAHYRRGQCFSIDAEDRFDQRACLDGRSAKPDVLLVGDSLAAHYWPGLASAGRAYELHQATMVGCRPLIFPADDDRPCARFFRRILSDWVPNRRPALVMLSGRWDLKDLPLLEKTVTNLKSQGIGVLLTGPVPRYNAPLPRLLLFAKGERKLADAGLAPEVFVVDRQMRDLAARQNISYFSPIEKLCVEQRCRVYATDAVPLQFDLSHFTVEGSRLVAQMLMPQLAAAASRPSVAQQAPAVR